MTRSYAMCKAAQKFGDKELSMCKTAQKHQRHRSTRCAKQHRNISDTGLLDVQNSTETSATQGYSMCKTAQKHQRHRATRCAKQHRSINDTGLLGVQNSTETSATRSFSMCETVQNNDTVIESQCRTVQKQMVLFFLVAGNKCYVCNTRLFVLSAQTTCATEQNINTEDCCGRFHVDV